MKTPTRESAMQNFQELHIRYVNTNKKGLENFIRNQTDVMVIKTRVFFHSVGQFQNYIRLH